MEHPVSRVIGHERDFNFFSREHEDSVPPFLVRCSEPVAANNPKRVPVEMNGMVPRRVVAHPKYIALAQSQAEHGFHVVMRVGNVAVDSPGLSAPKQTTVESQPKLSQFPRFTR